MSFPAASSSAMHIPVMLHEVLAAAQPKDGDVVVDGTFGAGGYSRALLSAARCRVIAFDRDPEVKLLADALAREFAPGHFFFIASRFSTMIEALAAHGITQVDAVVLDIGVSSMQIDNAARGFSFSKDAPLDMRMSREGVSAADIVNAAPEVELIRILRDYGEEREAKRIARAIIAARNEAPIETTKRLAEIVASVMRGGKIHPATRTFQALRIEVNQELAELEAALHAAEHILKPGGRLVVVSFHSLEDRIVKQFLTLRSNVAASTSRHSPAALLAQPVTNQPTFQLMPKQAITPSEQEVSQNSRARSAKLRCAIRTSVPLSH